MKDRYNQALKVVAISEEIEASLNFIFLGLKLLKEQNSPFSNNHVILQLFASGFERLLKIQLLVKDEYETGQFPNLLKAKERFREYDNGHGIEKMLWEMIDFTDTVDLFHKIPMIIEDSGFLITNYQFRKFITIITEFSIQQRYYYIDSLILENENKNFNPFDEFKKLIWSFEDNIDIEKQSHDEEEQIKLIDAVICIEKGARAIARFFSHGLGEVGKKYSFNFSKFLLLKDKDLGKLEYTINRPSISESYKSKSFISITYLGIRLFSKSKTINATDYKDWPFTIKSVTVYSHKNNFYFVRIAYKIYALTGKTCSRFKMPFYFESKKLRTRMLAVFLLDEAQRLRI